MSLENELVKLRETIEKLTEAIGNNYQTLGATQDVVSINNVTTPDVVVEQPYKTSSDIVNDVFKAEAEAAGFKVSSVPFNSDSPQGMAARKRVAEGGAINHRVCLVGIDDTPQTVATVPPPPATIPPPIHATVPPPTMVAPTPIPAADMTLKPAKGRPPKIITKDRAEEIAVLMKNIAQNLGTEAPLRDLLIEYDITGVAHLPRRLDDEFIKRLEEL